MKDLVEIIKNLNASNWINLLLAGLLWYAYTTTEKRIARLEKAIAREQENNKVIFKLYQDCIIKEIKPL